MRILKAVSILIAFGLAMVILLAIKGSAGSGRLLHKAVFIETAGDWRNCRLTGCEINADSIAVAFDNKEGKASLTTFPIESEFKFNQLILSWNIRHANGPGSYDFSVEVSGDGDSWYKFDYLTWGDSVALDDTGVKSIAGIGGMDVDVLKLTETMKFARVTVDFKGNGSTEKSFLRRLVVAFSRDNPNWRDLVKYHPRKDDVYYGAVKLSVPYISQRSLEANRDGGACSPTSA